ncbi:hypothetical protein BH23CHL4_BH23CHL4_07970 [soil metagenome]
MGTSDTITRIRSKVRGAKGSDTKFTGFCPAHDDRKNRSLSVWLKDSRDIGMKCHTGCTFEAICDALGEKQSDMFANPKKGYPSLSPSNNTATLQQSTRGYSLEDYAEDKQLELDFLKGCGLSTFKHQGAPAIRIPYLDANGLPVSVRFRIAADGDRFRWKSGSTLMLYGLHRIPDAMQQGYIFLVEGESDCHTLWMHGYPAVGIPGASNWNESRDAPHLADVPVIYFIREPDTGGETLTESLASSSLLNRIRIVDLGEYKDASGLHLAKGEGLSDALRDAMEASVRLAETVAASTQQSADDAWGQCSGIAQNTDILSLAATTVHHLGLTGEARNTKLMFLTLVSRLFERPVSAVVKGPSSAGKSYLVERVLMLMPGDAYYALSAVSDKVLAHSQEPIKHRHLIIYEAAGMSGDFASYLLRSLLSEGRIRYETMVQTSEGWVPRLIEREGPAGVILTTTAAKLHPENETRMLSLLASDSREQTREIMRTIATQAECSGADGNNLPDLTEWHALQAWLSTGERRVTIPYAMELANAIPTIAVRLRRDFGLLMTLIRAHALLHRQNRGSDSEGRIVATLSDYATVRELVADLMADGVEATVPASVRETVSTVREMLKTTPSDPTVSLAKLAKRLDLDKSAASRRVRVAIDREYLKNLEDKRGKPMRLTMGDEMPDELDILPSVEMLKCCSVDVLQGSERRPPPPNGNDSTGSMGDEETPPSAWVGEMFGTDHGGDVWF